MPFIQWFPGKGTGVAGGKRLILFVTLPDVSILALLAPTATNHAVLVAIFVWFPQPFKKPTW